MESAGATTPRHAVLSVPCGAAQGRILHITRSGNDGVREQGHGGRFLSFPFFYSNERRKEKSNGNRPGCRRRAAAVTEEQRARFFLYRATATVPCRRLSYFFSSAAAAVAVATWSRTRRFLEGGREVRTQRLLRCFRTQPENLHSKFKTVCLRACVSHS